MGKKQQQGGTLQEHVVEAGAKAMDRTGKPHKLHSSPDIDAAVAKATDPNCDWPEPPLNKQRGSIEEWMGPGTIKATKHGPKRRGGKPADMTTAINKNLGGMLGTLESEGGRTSAAGARNKGDFSG